MLIYDMLVIDDKQAIAYKCSVFSGVWPKHRFLPMRKNPCLVPKKRCCQIWRKTVSFQNTKECFRNS